MGLSLLLLALVLFGASQGALKISFDALFDEEYRDITVDDPLQVPVRFQRWFRAGYGNWESTLKGRR